MFIIENWWKILIALLIITAIVFLSVIYSSGLIAFPGENLQPVPAPIVSDKIKGYWSSEGPTTFRELNDADKMKAMGINTVTFSPMLSHDQEGRVTERPGNETYVKKTINKTHKNGIRVMLETTPMDMAAVSPKVKNVKLFQDQMTQIALKYAKIAEDYDVEYFAPIVEPVHHMTAQEADDWLHNLLPKLKAVYHGQVMWKKQSNDLTEPKEWNENHTFNLAFTTDSNELQLSLKSTPKHNIALSVSSQIAVLSEYAGENEKFREEKKVVFTPGMHNLSIKINNNQIIIQLDNEVLFNRADDNGPMGGYVINSQMRVKSLKVADLNGNILQQEKHENLNNWGWLGDKGLMIVDGQIEIPYGSDAKLIHDTDYSGYDYIAIDTFHRGKTVTIDEYIKDLEYVIKRTNEQAESDGVPHVILAEFGGSLKESLGWTDTDERERIPMSEDELALTTQKVLELAENTVDGYIYNGWNVEKQGLNKLPKVNTVVKDWYLSH